MFHRRDPITITLEILNRVEEKGEATKWDLLKILGNEPQFRVWIHDFLIKSSFLEEKKEGRYYFYKKTELGKEFHKFLKNGHIIRGFLIISGKKLKTDYL